MLAVELHRSDYHTAVKPGRDGNYICWNHCGLLDLKLTAAGGVAPNCGRPEGVQVWNQDCNDRTSVYDYGESPETLAEAYSVRLWSDRHWELMARSMDLLAGLGVQIAQIPVVDKTRLGNEEGMVTWVKKPDGKFDYDYSLVEKYLKLVKKHLGVPKFVVLCVYHPAGWHPAKPDQENTVTVLDPQTGQREHLQVPIFGTDENKEFFAPVLLGLKERLAKEGMEKSLVIGQLTEGIPGDSLFKEFSDILARIWPNAAARPSVTSWIFAIAGRMGRPACTRTTTAGRRFLSGCSRWPAR